MNDLKKRYFEWMYKLACDRQYTNGESYHKLCHALDEREFVYSIPMDANCFDHGIEFRYRFGYEKHISDSEIASELDIRPCSLFEMMVSLAFRCEEHIMSNPELGDRTSLWFMDMLHSIGIDHLTDSNFSQREFDMAIDILLDREYEPNGKGGLFTISDPRRDMRTADFWYQAMWYLSEVLDNSSTY